MAISDLGIQMRINRLNRARNDLRDDSNSIREINGKINNIIEDVQSFIQVGSSAITSKLDDLKEPYQSNDADITNARTYLQYEINYLNRKLED